MSDSPAMPRLHSNAWQKFKAWCWIEIEEWRDRRSSAASFDFDADAATAIRLQNAGQSRAAIRLSLVMLLVLLLWSVFAEVDEYARGDGKVIPSGEVQVLQHVDGGIVEAILVHEGDTVQKGQVLLRIDPTRAQSNFAESAAQETSLRLKVLRLQALSQNQPFQPPEDLKKTEAPLIEQERQLYDSSLNELKTAQNIAADQLQQKQHELDEILAKRSQARSAYELATRELNITRPLVKSGAVSDVELLRLERDVNQLQGERNALESQVPRQQAAVREASQKVHEAELRWRNDIRRDLSEASGKLAAIAQGTKGLADRVTQTEVRSPVRGTIKQLFIHTVGGVAQAGKDIVEIVPLDDNLLLEARVLPKDIAFVQVGQNALVKFTAYDFSIYGGLDARVEQISADTVVDEKGNAFYIVKVRTKKSGIGPKELPILPGMVAEVDIVTGHRTVLQYLLKPILRAQGAAFRES